MMKKLAALLAFFVSSQAFALGGTACVVEPLSVAPGANANTLQTLPPCTLSGREIVNSTALPGAAVFWNPSYSMARDDSCTWSASNLPTGVSMNPANGQISGSIPNAEATYSNISATCTTAAGANTETWSLTVAGVVYAAEGFVSGNYGTAPGYETFIVNEDTASTTETAPLQGSFAACILDRNGPPSNPTPRRCGFAGNQYTLFQAVDYNIALGNLTIDCLNAPGGSVDFVKEGPFGNGVTKNGGISVVNTAAGNQGSNTYIQGCRVVGLKPIGNSNKVNGSGGFGVDGENSALPSDNVVFDQVSVISVQDDGLTIYGASDNVTIIDSTIMESGRGIGLTYADESLPRNNMAVIRTTLARNTERNPVVRADTNNVEIQDLVVHAMGPSQHNVGGLQTTAGINIRDRGVTCPESVNMRGVHVTSSPDSTFLSASLNILDDCNNSQLYFEGRLPAEETETGGAAQPFNNGLTYTPANLATVISNAGAPNPTVLEAAVRAEMLGQYNTDLGVNTNLATYLIPQPETRCAELVNAGNTCGDGTLHCVSPGAGWQTAFSTAYAAMDPNEAVCLRAGTYVLTSDTIGTADVTLNRNGTGEAGRLYIGNYPGENAVFLGAGDEASWNDRADLSAPTADRQGAIAITGDYHQVEGDLAGFDLRFVPEVAIVNNGDYNKVYGVSIQNVYGSRGGYITGYAVFGGIDDTEGWGPDGRWGTADDTGPDGVPDILYDEFKWNHVAHTYRASSLTLHVSTDTGGNAFDIGGGEYQYNTLMYAGYEIDGDKVPPAGGDPAGGGNADHIAFRVVCEEQSPDGVNHCRDFVVSDNFMYRAADDCVDQQVERVDFRRNVIRLCGPEGNRGIKVKQDTDAVMVVGNFCHNGGVDSTSCFEGSPGGPQGQEMRGYFNGAFYTTGADAGNDYGIDANGGGSWEDNAASFNFINMRSNPSTTNYVVDNAAAYESPTEIYPAETFVIADNSTLTAIEKLAAYIRPYVEDFKPAAGSPLIDAGSVTGRTDYDGNSVVCPRANDNATNPFDPTDADFTPDCLQWCGAAPDRGPFETGAACNFYGE